MIILETTEFAVFRIIHLCTNHLTKKVFDSLEVLDKAEAFPFTYLKHYHGCILILTDLEEFYDSLMDEEDFKAEYPDLHAILSFCEANNINYINFDADTLTVKKFKTYKW